MSNLEEIRSVFLQYFLKNDHTILPSGALVPSNDPTLLFTNAGMVQFRNIFTGLEPAPCCRAVTVQKCLRAGGKHNDLETVGHTSRHHTFFEMLGNFSFGDYFKERAIQLAWNLVIKEFGLSADRLLVTVHDEDDEAARLWKKISGLPDDKIIPIGTGDNFWSMGNLGPCGPCSEIFYDHGADIPGGPPGSAEQDGDRFVEIWNLVFMQFDQKTDKDRIALPHPSIDTGMGLERIAAVLQGCRDNYDIDLFRSLIQFSESLIGVKAEGQHKVSYRVIADHLRAAAFLIVEGVFPSNEGRGYVLRRILRRAMRHAHLLGVREPLIHKLVPMLIQNMGSAWPELVSGETTISDIISQEEIRFLDMLSRGLGLISSLIASPSKGSILDGENVFKLYDTYGFPPDLTQDILKQYGMLCDLEGFYVAMQQQKSRSRASWSGSGEKTPHSIEFALKEKFGATDFSGYEQERGMGEILSLVRHGEAVSRALPGEDVELILNTTPFYAESGGQLSDSGVIFTEDLVVEVCNVRKTLGQIFVHTGKVIKGVVQPSIPVELKVDHKRRMALSSNHSATHLIHAALRSVLGEHVVQRGSLVAHDRLRFDFSHFKPIDPDEIEEIERIVNEQVLGNHPVNTRLMSLKEAKQHGATALFGEKYGEKVRVVSMGVGLEDATKEVFSMELCGGTHVSFTGHIGLVRIISETPVGSGVRRIEAQVGEIARIYLGRQDHSLKAIAALLKVSGDDVFSRVERLLNEKKKLERELLTLRSNVICSEKQGFSPDKPIKIGHVSFLSKTLDNALPNDLRSLVDEEKKSLGSGIVAVFSKAGSKVSLVVGVTDDLTSQYDASDFVRSASLTLGGQGGGGRRDMAQSGGADASRIPDAIDVIKSMIQKQAVS